MSDEELLSTRLRAEVRAVEEGHTARLTDAQDVYLVKSDTDHDREHLVTALAWQGGWYFVCSCPAGIHNTLCKHSQLVARRLEREGRAYLSAWDTWVYDHDPIGLGDPFEGLS